MRDTPVTYVIFDPHLDGRLTLPLAYEDRRALLEELELEGPAWRTPPTTAARAAPPRPPAGTASRAAASGSISYERPARLALDQGQERLIQDVVIGGSTLERAGAAAGSGRSRWA